MNLGDKTLKAALILAVAFLLYKNFKKEKPPSRVQTQTTPASQPAPVRPLSVDLPQASAIKREEASLAQKAPRQAWNPQELIKKGAKDFPSLLNHCVNDSKEEVFAFDPGLRSDYAMLQMCRAAEQKSALPCAALGSQGREPNEVSCRGDAFVYSLMASLASGKPSECVMALEALRPFEYTKGTDAACRLLFQAHRQRSIQAINEFLSGLATAGRERGNYIWLAGTGECSSWPSQRQVKECRSWADALAAIEGKNQSLCPKGQPYCDVLASGKFEAACQTIRDRIARLYCARSILKVLDGQEGSDSLRRKAEAMEKTYLQQLGH